MPLMDTIAALCLSIGQTSPDEVGSSGPWAADNLLQKAGHV
jgi:hypothetical protein